MNNKTETFWDLLEVAPDYAEHTTGLVSWSLNYDNNATNPLNAFLTLVSFASEDLEDYALAGNSMPELSWLELDLIGKALVEYSARPQDCSAWLVKLLNADR
jgi:hypothetical protein